jgi:hypothetical protein
VTGGLERPVTLVFQGLWTFNLPETSIDVIINFFEARSDQHPREVGREVARADLCRGSGLCRARERAVG